MEVGLKKMVAKCSKNITFLLLILFTLLLDSNVVQGWGRLSEEEDLELDRQLQLINKPAIKSFQTQYGEIIDCIDIYKQIAFDHPLLKNHTIQMKPKLVSKRMKDEGSRTNAFPAYVANISCPPGSIAIKRTTKEDLIIDKYKKSTTRNYPTNKSWQFSADGKGFFHSAAVVFHGKIKGAKAAINIWKPTVYTNQCSRGGIQIAGGLNVITAGWEVRKWNYSRLYISWSVNNDFCINHICPGFVQVSPKIALGSYLSPSTYKGHQYEIRIGLSQDITTGNWWFLLRDQNIGYWPQALFTNLAEGGSKVSWGGQVYSPITKHTPAMGSGHFPGEGYGKSAYVRGIKVLTNKTHVFEDPKKSAIEMDIDKPYCSNALYKVSKNPQWGHHLFFGGPGRCPFN